MSWENIDGSSLCSWKFPATMTQAGSSAIFLLMVRVGLGPEAASADGSAETDLPLCQLPEPPKSWAWA